MVDPDRVRRLLSQLDEYVGALRTLGALDVDRYLEERFAGRYLVLAAAQVVIDVANHVISSEGWRVPADFRDGFTVLEEHDVLDAELAERLRALAGLRNRLVHLYADVDDTRVHHALAQGVVDLETCASQVARFMTPD